jgi:hypothetical protein
LLQQAKNGLAGDPGLRSTNLVGHWAHTAHGLSST